jgi:hypothetical protein
MYHYFFRIQTRALGIPDISYQLFAQQYNQHVSYAKQLQATPRHAYKQQLASLVSIAAIIMPAIQQLCLPASCDMNLLFPNSILRRSNGSGSFQTSQRLFHNVQPVALSSISQLVSLSLGVSQA